MLASGVLMWLNMRPVSAVWTATERRSMDDFIPYTQFGWPSAALLRGRTISEHFNSTPKRKSWVTEGIIVDGAVAAVILLIVCYVCEGIIRRRRQTDSPA